MEIVREFSNESENLLLVQSILTVVPTDLTFLVDCSKSIPFVGEFLHCWSHCMSSCQLLKLMNFF